MERLLIGMFVAMFVVSGCGTYNSSQVPLTEPKNQSYCQRIGDMAVGMEPYMMKDKTILVFDNDLQKEEVMALNVSMIANGGTSYIVRKDDIKAMDEFGNEYSPMSPSEVAGRIDRALRADAGLESDLEGRDMPDEVTVGSEMTQHFIYYDMTGNKAESRRWTMRVPATSTDGKTQKSFMLTVDPMRTHMNPTEKWSSYDERGVTPCMAEMKKVEAPTAKAEPPVMKDESAKKETEKQERMFEKSLMK